MFPIYILAGGLGTRLGDKTKKIPKCMIDINGNPFIYYQLKRLKDSGIERVTLCLGHFSDQVLTYLESNPIEELSIEYILDGEKHLGTGGAIKNAIRNIKEPFFVTYGDSLLDVDYTEIIKTYDADHEGPLMVIFKNRGKYDTSNVSLKSGRVMYSKSVSLEDSEFIDYGLSIFHPRHFALPKDVFDLSEVQEHYSKRGELQHFIAKNRFYEMGSPEGLTEIKSILNED